MNKVDDFIVMEYRLTVYTVPKNVFSRMVEERIDFIPDSMKDKIAEDIGLKIIENCKGKKSKEMTRKDYSPSQYLVITELMEGGAFQDYISGPTRRSF